MNELLYWTMVALFFTHELDAVGRREWRLLPIVNRFPDKIAEQIFICAHVPIFPVIVLMSKNGIYTLLPLGLSVFAIIHVGLHWYFRRHAKNEFKGLASWSIIVLAGVFGALHLMVFAIG